MDFSILTTSAEWVATLQDLTSLVTKAIRNSSVNDINNLRNVIEDYREKLRENSHISEFRSLDRLSSNVLTELNNAALDIALTNLSNLTNQLKTLDTQLSNLASDSTQTAEELQLKNTKEFLTKTKTSLTILKGLKTELDDNRTNISQVVKVIFKAIQDFEIAFPDA